jgi:cobalt-zinc-cadmium efflux system protein
MHFGAEGHYHAHAQAHAHPARGQSALGWAMLATLALVAAEIVGGTLGRSVALLNDALHNLSDVPALVISWLALRWVARPADSEKTYGYHRAGILAAFANAVLLVIVALGLGYEAVERLRNPVAVREGWMIWTSLAALAVNGGITLALVPSRHDLNLRSILLHNFGDSLSNIGILAGAFAIRATGAHWLDPAIGLAIGALVLWSSYGILRDSSHILLEGSPRSVAVEEVARAILEIPGVQEVHDVHIWTLGPDLHALSCHARIPDMHMDESERILDAINDRLCSRFHITHSTVQFERAGLPRTGIYMPEPAAHRTDE